jgi:hypothetical protein
VTDWIVQILGPAQCSTRRMLEKDHCVRVAAARAFAETVRDSRATGYLNLLPFSFN